MVKGGGPSRVLRRNETFGSGSVRLTVTAVITKEVQLMIRIQHDTAKLEACFSLGMPFTITMTKGDWKTV